MNYSANVTKFKKKSGRNILLENRKICKINVIIHHS